MTPKACCAEVQPAMQSGRRSSSSSNPDREAHAQQRAEPGANGLPNSGPMRTASATLSPDFAQGWSPSPSNRATPPIQRQSSGKQDRVGRYRPLENAAAALQRISSDVQKHSAEGHGLPTAPVSRQNSVTRQASMTRQGSSSAPISRQPSSGFEIPPTPPSVSACMLAVSWMDELSECRRWDC